MLSVASIQWAVVTFPNAVAEETEEPKPKAGLLLDDP